LGSYHSGKPQWQWVVVLSMSFSLWTAPPPQWQWVVCGEYEFFPLASAVAVGGGFEYEFFSLDSATAAVAVRIFIHEKNKNKKNNLFSLKTPSQISPPRLP
jgi:hypothetical protein